MPADQYIGWCFTINQPDKVDLMKDLGEKYDDKVKYCCFALEIAPTTGHKHFQGYLEMVKKITLTGIKKLFNEWGAHWEPRKGTREQARDYCMGMPDENGNKTKEGVLGVWETEGWDNGGQGARNDLKAVVDMLKNGASIYDIAYKETSSFLKYHKGIERAHALFSPKRTWKTEVIVLFGKTDVGKSRIAWETFPDAYGKSAEHTWWDGYAGEETVIIDDYEGEFDFRYLLRLLDRYPLQIQVKGGMTQFNSYRIVITSNRHPEEWYAMNSRVNHDDIKAMKRRITRCMHLFRNPDTSLVDCVELFNNKNSVDEVAGNTALHSIFGINPSVSLRLPPQDASSLRSDATSPSLRSGDNLNDENSSLIDEEVKCFDFNHPNGGISNIIIPPLPRGMEIPQNILDLVNQVTLPVKVKKR